MELNLKIVGILLILLAISHVFFPKYFGWKKSLSVMNLLDRQVMYVHTLFIAITVLLMGALCLSNTEDLLTTSMGSNIMIGFAMFWGLRLLIQFIGYSSLLWRGKKFETVMHWIFVLMFSYLTFVFAAGA